MFKLYSLQAYACISILIPYIFPIIYQPTKPKSYSSPNPDHITPATTTMVTIIIAKVNNIPVTNSYPNTSANPTMVTIIIVKPYDIPVANSFSICLSPIPIPILLILQIRQLILSFPKLCNFPVTNTSII